VQTKSPIECEFDGCDFWIGMVVAFVCGALLGAALVMITQYLLYNKESDVSLLPPCTTENPTDLSPIVAEVLDSASLKSLDNWRQLYLAVFRKIPNWSHVVIIIDSLASVNSRYSPSMLSIARWRSLCLQDLISFTRTNKIGWFSNSSEAPCVGCSEDGDPNEDEEAYWKARENVLSEDYPSAPILPLDTAYSPLQLLKADRPDKRFDVLFCLPSTDSSSDTNLSLASRRPSALEDLDSSLKKFARVAQELVETEKVFVRDVGKLVLLLTELRFSTLASVRAFCQTVPFTAILSSATVFQTVHTEFLNRIQSFTVSAVETDLQTMETVSANLLSALRLYSPLFPLLAQYVVHHDSFSCLYNSHMTSLEEFQHFLSNCERAMGETMASLVIKPVQRLPRYVLLCQEMRKIITKAEELFASSLERDSLEGEETSNSSSELSLLLRTMASACEQSCQTVSSAAHACNELVRAHQDTIRMHELHDLLLLGGSHLPSSLPVVVKERRFIREGDLLRHHKNSSMRPHRVQLFSDVLLSSAPSTPGSSSTALYLEQHVSLKAGSGTFCIPLPSPAQQREVLCPHWFLLAAAHKNLYFGCKSESEAMRWVEAIQRCLSLNEADPDECQSRRQLELINALLRELESQRRGGEGLQTRDPSEVISLQQFQSCWWQLLSSPAALSPALQTLSRQLHQHGKEVASHLILTILCDDEDRFEGKSPVTALLFTDQPHHLLATGLFFEYSRSSSSLALGERPSVVRLFLFHDLLLAAYLSHVNRPLTYAFHIPLSSLRCADYRHEEVGELAILLSDTCPQRRGGVRRRSLINRIMSREEEGGSPPSGQQEGVRRVLFAATVSMKFDWLSLLMEAIAASTSRSESLVATASVSLLPVVSGRISLAQDPLHPLWIDQLDQEPSR
jgi:hypothetical protein